MSGGLLLTQNAAKFLTCGAITFVKCMIDLLVPYIPIQYTQIIPLSTKKFFFSMYMDSYQKAANTLPAPALKKSQIMPGRKSSLASPALAVALASGIGYNEADRPATGRI